MEYFEDLVVGKVNRFGAYAVTREDVIDFAGKFDPQPFHLNDEAAAQTHFGRVSASGWHTCAMTMRMLVDNLTLRGHQGLGSPGVDEIRWLRPVYPGDTLRCENQLLEKRRSRSKPSMGLIRSMTRVLNQNDEVVMTLIANGMVQVRDPSSDQP